MAKSSHQPRGKSRKKRLFFLRKGFWLTLIVLGAVCGAVAWIYADNYLKPYRERAEIYDMERINDLEIPSIIADRNGEEIGRFFVQNRAVISIDEVPQVFINALMSGEDQRFMQHKGVDYYGIGRAAWYNYKGSRQGASTITQQLARNAYNLKTEADKRGESEIDRKLVEIFLALRIERHYGKREILEFYLNRIYFGSGFYGIRSASLGYYGKEPMDLTVEESASLVTLIKNPTGRSPLNNPEANLHGRNYVLGRMHADGHIRRRERDEAQLTPLKLNPRPLRRGTSQLYERISDAVTNALGEEALESGGFTIHTTILASAQRAAEDALLESLARAEQHPGFTRQRMHEYQRGADEDPEFLQGAVLMVEHDTGEVLVHVGGRDYSRAQYDFIELGRRPLGTTFHPFVHIASLEHGGSPVQIVEDLQMDNRAVMIGGREGVLGEWGMEVDNPVYEGEITARRALEASKIAANVRLANQVGIERVIQTAARFGLNMQDAERLPRIAVGFEDASLRQVVRAYSAIPRGGKPGRRDLMYLDRIVNQEGRTVWRHTRAAAQDETATDAATAWQVHDMLASSLERGSAQGALEKLIESPFHGGGKTGTSADFSDNWFVGYNSRITCGVWAGFLTSGGESIYPGAFSRDIAMPVWIAAMNAAAPSFRGDPPQPPENIVELEVCSVSGQRSTSFCQHQVEDLESGRIVTRSTAITEWFRRDAAHLPYCSTHSGGIDALDGGRDGVAAIHPGSGLNASPIRPTAPAVLGDDPFLTEVPAFVTTDTTSSGIIRRRTNVLDSLELDAFDEPLRLRRPPRLQILDE
ncbi:MAG: transglycosylase domain-containing protein [Luteolibacter sp.]